MCAPNTSQLLHDLSGHAALWSLIPAPPYALSSPSARSLHSGLHYGVKSLCAHFSPTTIPCSHRFGKHRGSLPPGADMALLPALLRTALSPPERVGVAVTFCSQGHLIFRRPVRREFTAPGPAKTLSPQNPCAVAPQGNAVTNPCQPARPLTNPCAASNPCGPTSSSGAAQNPCAPVNPCAAPAGEQRGMGPLLSLVAHLVYGGVVGLVYRSRRT